MNIVKIQHYGKGGTFLFSVPDGIQLSKNQKVTVLTKYGEKEGTCVVDSMVIDDKVLEYLAAVAQYKLPLKPVLGIWGYQEFEKPEVKEPEVVRLLCVKDEYEGCRLTKGKVYEYNGGMQYDNDDFRGGKCSFTEWKRINPNKSVCLFPLVNRPARVGEWVLYDGVVYKVDHICFSGCIVLTDGRYIKNLHTGSNPYEVIDGYNGEYHA